MSVTEEYAKRAASVSHPETPGIRNARRKEEGHGYRVITRGTGTVLEVAQG